MRTRSVLAAVLALSSSRAPAETLYLFRMVDRDVAVSAQGPGPAQQTDAATGITVSVPCGVCRVRAGSPVLIQPSVSGTQGEATWALATGTLPAGVSVDPRTGLVSGSAAGPGSFTLAVTDARGRPASSPPVAFQLVEPPAVSYAGSTGATGRTVDLRPSLSNVTGPAAYALASGVLPAGLALDASTGRIAGIPAATALGLSVRVTDSDGASAVSPSFDVLNADQSSITFVGAAYQGRTGVPLTVRPTLFGMPSPAALSLAAGTLPPGMGLVASTGQIEGTPTVAGSYTGIALAGMDAGGSPVRSAPIAITVAKPSLSYMPVTAWIGQPYVLQPGVEGLVRPTFTRVGGPFPPGLSVSAATGAVTGTPTATGTYPGLQVTGIDGDLAQATSDPFALTVGTAAVTATPPSAAATEGATFAFSATTTLPNPSWSVSGNPPWMTFAAAGGTYGTSSVSADVSATANYSVVLKAAGGGTTAQQTVAVTVNPAEVSLRTIPSVRTGAPFSGVVTQTMGVPGRWSVSPGEPDVTDLAATDTLLSGRAPANDGIKALTRIITATRTATAGPASGTPAYASGTAILTVYPALSIARPADRYGTVGSAAFFPNPSVIGGAGAATYTLLSGAGDVSAGLGAICPGLSFDTASGAISGVPTATCSAVLSYRIADSGGQYPATLAGVASSATFTLAVTDVGVTPSARAVSVTEGDEVVLSATTTLPAPTWSVSGNPAWMTFAAGPGGSYATSGISPDVSVETTFEVTLTAMNSAPAIVSAKVPVTVRPATVTVPDRAARSGRGFTVPLATTMAVNGRWAAAAGPVAVAGLDVTGSTLSGFAPSNPGPSPLTRTLTVTRTAAFPPALGSAATATGTGTLTVHPPLSVGASADAGGVIGTAVSIPAPSTVGAVGSLAYALIQGGQDVSGDLSATCPGLSFNPATGVVSGTPTAACSTRLAYLVTDDGKGDANLAATETGAAFNLAVAGVPLAATASTSAIAVTEGSTVTFSATSATAGVTWSASGNPPWMTFAQSGASYGTSSVSTDVASVQTHTVALTATDASGATATTNVSVEVSPATASLSAAAARSGGAFSMTLSDTMAAAATWTAPATQGDVTGVAASGSTLSGVAPAFAGPGTTTRTLAATHTANAAPSNGAAAASQGSGTLTVHPALAIASGTGRTGTAGTALTFGPPTVSGKVGTLAYALLQGTTDVSATLNAICPGLGFTASTGTVSGTPTAACSTVLSYSVSDDGAGDPALAGSVGSQTFALAVNAAPAAASVSVTPEYRNVYEGDRAGFSATTTIPNPTWNVSGAPPWMTFTTTNGTLSSASVTPNVDEATNFDITLEATGQGFAPVSKPYRVIVLPGSLMQTPDRTVRSGMPWTATASASLPDGGTWTAVGSPLAVSGATYDPPSGTVTGDAPTVAGTSPVLTTVTLTYAAPPPSSGTAAYASTAFKLTTYPTLAVTGIDRPNYDATEGQPFAGPTIGAIGLIGNGSLSFSGLPKGVAYQPASKSLGGIVDPNAGDSGTTYDVTATLTDDGDTGPGKTAQASFTITLSRMAHLTLPPSLAVADQSMPANGSCTMLTLTNGGGMPADGLALALLQSAGGTQASTDFKQCVPTSGTACGTSLAAGATCSYGIQLASTTAGDKTGVASVSSTGAATVTSNLSGKVSNSGLYTFSGHTFTNCNQSGSYGPSQSQCRAAYPTQPWASNTAYYSVSGSGYQLWTVPSTGNYTITATGAQGGYVSGQATSGAPARLSGTYALTQGESILLIVGQAGQYTGGGGGSWVYSKTRGALLMVAGGGGAAGWSQNNGTSNGGGATTGTTAGNGTYGGGLTTGANACTSNSATPGGAGGNGGGAACGAGGGGFSGAGRYGMTYAVNGTSVNVSGSPSFQTAMASSGLFAGGTNDPSGVTSAGGFGGGGGGGSSPGYTIGGGGGGYSGGGGGGYSTSSRVGSGGGGGSYALNPGTAGVLTGQAGFLHGTISISAPQ